MTSFSKVEVPNHTPEQAKGYLEASLELLDTLPVPEDIRGEFFVQAVQLLSGKQVILQPQGVPPIGALPDFSRRM